MTLSIAIFSALVVGLTLLALMTNRRWISRSIAYIVFLAFIFADVFMLSGSFRTVLQEAQNAGQLNESFALGIQQVSDAIWSTRALLLLLAVSLLSLAVKGGNTQQ